MRTRVLGSAAAVAVVVVVVLAAVSGLGTANPTSTSSGLRTETRAVRHELHGIPQDGISLGSRDAPATLVERHSPQVARLLVQARREAGRLGVTSTPSFFLVRPGGRPQRLQVSAFTTRALSRAIDQALSPQS